MHTSASEQRLGLVATTALVVGHTIGVGVFLTPATLIQSIASPVYTLCAWLLFGALVFGGALAFGELASRFPRAGGPFVYLREAWGGQIAFLYGWQCLLVMDPGISAALASGASRYLAAGWPAVGEVRWIPVLLIWSLAAIAIAGLKLSSRVLGVLTAFKVGSLVAIVVMAFGSERASWAHLAATSATRLGSLPSGEAVALAFVGAFFSFGGFWEASRMAGEVRNPNRILPRALGSGVAIVTALYVLTTAAFLALAPADTTLSAVEFTRRAGLALAGTAGPALLAFVVLMSVVASLAAMLMMAPRLYVAMAREGALPVGLASARPGTDHSPRATALLAALASLYTWLGTFEQIVAFFFCTALLFVALAVAGLLPLRRKGAGQQTTFRCPGYPVVPLAFVCLTLAVVAIVAAARPVEALAGAGIVLLGVPIYRLGRVGGVVEGQFPQEAQS